MQSCRLRTEYSVGDTQSTRYLQPAQCSWQRRHSCPPSATGEPSWHICLGNLVFCCWPFWRPAARQLEKYRRSLGNDQRDSARRRDICGPVLADYERHEGRYPGAVVGRLGGQTGAEVAGHTGTPARTSRRATRGRFSQTYRPRTEGTCAASFNWCICRTAWPVGVPVSVGCQAARPSKRLSRKPHEK